MLASFPDTLKDALFILRVRFVSRLRRKQCCGFIQFAAGFDTQLIYPRLRRSGGSALGGQTGRPADERTRPLRGAPITWRGGFLPILAGSRMRQLPARNFVQRVRDSRKLAINRMSA